MVEYKCLRCGYIGKEKRYLKNHLNRKNICKPILDDINIENIKKIYGFEKKSNLSNTQEIGNKIKTQNIKNIENIQNIENIEDEEDVEEIYELTDVQYEIIKNFIKEYHKHDVRLTFELIKNIEEVLSEVDDESENINNEKLELIKNIEEMLNEIEESENINNNKLEYENKNNNKLEYENKNNDKLEYENKNNDKL